MNEGVVTIRTREYTQSTPDGLKTFYSVQVHAPFQAGVVGSINTSNPKIAAEYLSKVQQSYPTTEVSGPSAASWAKKSKIDVPPTSDGLTPPNDAAPSVSNTEDIKKLNSLGSGSGDQPEIMKVPMKKKAVDLSGLPKKQQQLYKSLSPKQRIERKLAGPFCGKQLEAVPNRLCTPGEKIVGQAPSAASFIVCGRDRPRSTASGYGGKGHTQASCIDLVAGLGGYKPKQVDTDDSKVYTDPDFFKDAARIYISQKTDVDENFAIGKKENYFKSEAKSAIGIKADNVRLVARESIVLATNTDRRNSQGGEIRQWSGIHLMANNDEDGLQPIPRGDNLKDALFKLSEYIEAVVKITHGYIKYQAKFNRAVAMHTHISPFFALPTLPSQACIQAGITEDIEVLTKTELSILKKLTNLAGFRHNFLVASGKSFINSRYNKTN